MPFYAMNFDHRITYVAAYLDTLTKAHTKLLEAHSKHFNSVNARDMISGLTGTGPGTGPTIQFDRDQNWYSHIESYNFHLHYN